MLVFFNNLIKRSNSKQTKLALKNIIKTENKANKAMGTVQCKHTVSQINLIKRAASQGMFLHKVIFFGIIFVAFLMSASYKSVFASIDKQNQENGMIYIKTTHGVIKIKTFDSVAPNHVKRVKELADKGFYNNVPFHRVMEGFMAQTGDPTGTGTGGSGVKLKAEFSNISHKRGIVSMARASDPNSADSQFFIVLKDSPFLDGQYTVFGKVVEGMEVVDKIKKANPNDPSGMVQNPDKIVKMFTSDV